MVCGDLFEVKVEMRNLYYKCKLCGTTLSSIVKKTRQSKTQIHMIPSHYQF